MKEDRQNSMLKDEDYNDRTFENPIIQLVHHLDHHPRLLLHLLLDEFIRSRENPLKGDLFITIPNNIHPLNRLVNENSFSTIFLPFAPE